jgi:membrane protease YdiL (CAAX protease family)
MYDILVQIKNDFSRLDRKAVVALVYTAIGLTCAFYVRNTQAVATFLRGTVLEPFGEWITNTTDNNLPDLSWWVILLIVFYLAIPVLIIKRSWHENLADYGLKIGFEDGFGKVLAACVALMLPLVYLMSLTEGFAAKYPFLQIYNGESYISQTLLIWELIYFLQFFGLEFFFRGFLLHSLKPSLGIHSIFVMTVPYTMIHFGKPPAETFSAIIAGIFLGWLSYRNGSIWLGLGLHCTVAFSMDILALYHKGLL